MSTKSTTTPRPPSRRSERRARLAAALFGWIVAGAAASGQVFGPAGRMRMMDHLLCCGGRNGDRWAGLDGGPALQPLPSATHSGVDGFAGDTMVPLSEPAPVVAVPQSDPPVPPAAVMAVTAPGAPGPAPAPAAPPAAEAKTVEGVPLVGFEKLAAFEFKAPDLESGPPDAQTIAAGEQQIPVPIKALNQTSVAVTGFMLPVKMDGGLVKEFLLVRDPMLCCYGVMPKVNEWVVVKMTGKGVQPLMDVPITFVGRLRVGQMFENGYLTGIYLLEGERQAEVKG